MGLFDNANIVAINNKLVRSIVTSDGGVLYEKTDMVSLSIDVPLNLVYSDAFSITGALTDVHDDGISGETVDLYVGDTLVDSTTTDSNGEYEFTQTPVSAGAHSFQVKYAGNTSYSSTTSSKVWRMVGKETTLLSVTSPVDNSTYYVGGAINVSGTLLTDDGEPVGNKTINYKLDGSTITSINTNNDGSISFLLGTISTGSHTIELSYAGDSNYTGSSVTRHITVLDHNYAISISCSTPVIQTGDSATIVATLTDNGVAVSGKSVVFKNGSTVLDTVTTDSNGQASYNYTGTGAGDITFTVESMSLQETFVIQDCHFYDNATVNRSSEYTTKIGAINLSHVTDHYEVRITNSKNDFSGVTPTSINSINNWRMECDLTCTTISGFLAFLDSLNYISHTEYFSAMQIGVYNYKNGGWIIPVKDTSISPNNWYTVIIELVNNVISVIVIDKTTNNEIYNENYNLPSTYQNKTIYPTICAYYVNDPLKFKNVKIKAL